MHKTTYGLFIILALLVSARTSIAEGLSETARIPFLSLGICGKGWKV